MKFGSVCSGIEAASVAWHPLGWQAAWFAEIEPFPCAVLAHHYPTVPNLGDMTTIAKRVMTGEVDAPDVLAGGTPCQAFSVAGLRESLADERGNLTLKFVELADAIDFVRVRDGRPPAIVFWENVPGVLSTKDNAFGCFLAGLAGEDEPLRAPGGKWANAGAVYGPARAIAWRTLDAQYFGLAQRRRRVFVVASARDGFDPATVLFEWDGVRRDSAPSREAREGSAGRAEAGATSGGYTPEVTGALTARSVRNMGQSNDDVNGHKIISMAHGQGGAEIGLDRSPTLTCNHEAPIAAYPATTHTLRGEGFDTSEDGTGRGTPLVPVAFSCKDYGADAGEVAPTLRSMGHDKSHANAGGQIAIAFNARQDPDHWHDRTGPLDTDGSTQAVAFAQNSRDEVRLEGGDGQRCGAISTGGGKPGQGVPMIATTQVAGAMSASGATERKHGFGWGQQDWESGYCQPDAHMRVRRLTPTECARLQGLPDDYLDITYRGKPAADGPKYKAIGNSWADPCVTWIGQRIAASLELLTPAAPAPPASRRAGAARLRHFLRRPRINQPRQTALRPSRRAEFAADRLLGLHRVSGARGCARSATSAAA